MGGSETIWAIYVLIGRQPNRALYGRFHDLLVAENMAEELHSGGLSVEIDQVTTRMIRRWHNPDDQ